MPAAVASDGHTAAAATVRSPVGRTAVTRCRDLSGGSGRPVLSANLGRRSLRPGACIRCMSGQLVLLLGDATGGWHLRGAAGVTNARAGPGHADRANTRSLSGVGRHVL